MATTSDAHLQELPGENKPKLEHVPCGNDTRKRKYVEDEFLESKKRDGYETMINPFVFQDQWLAMESLELKNRNLAEAAIGPPYFYYENVAQTLKGVWDTLKQFLYDSKYFCTAARKRGYIHNLPICNRFPILPLPPDTINEAFALTNKWWQTSIATATITERIRKALEACYDEPSPEVQKYVADVCRRWNLVWVGKNKVAPLEPDEVEMLLGFPRNHTRGGGISRADRYKSLGNSFQVDMVAYHLFVLKDLYPGGINVISLFSRIGGAEVALHRLGIPLNNVVLVGKCEVNRNIMRSWWEQTNQKANLIDFVDVQKINAKELKPLVDLVGGFDLIIGGSPCNNLTGN